MKKSVLALILVAVFVIIVSPAIVGRLAEDRVGENINWAAEESGELVVTSQGFDRGWFSSEGQHRVELGEGSIRAGMTPEESANIPVLLINTRIDHGLIPLSSLSRDEGSLAPGLGSAVSTLVLEYSDGETIDLPGVVYSQVGLSGDLDSRYVVEAGARSVDDGEVTWQPTTISIDVNSNTGNVEFSGDVGTMTFANDQQVVSIDSLAFEGQQANTPYGFYVGDVDLSVGTMTITRTEGVQVGGMQGMTVKGFSSVDDGEAEGAVRLEMSNNTVPGFGDVSVIADMTFHGLDAGALGAVSKRVDDADATDPNAIMMSAEQEFKDLFAAGVNFDVDQFDIALPMGTVEATMSFSVPASDRASFEWTTLLLDAVATIDVIVPEALVEYATSMDPQAGALIGMGYLKKEGDAYIMDADFKKGLLTINGAPVPIPQGAFQ